MPLLDKFFNPLWYKIDGLASEPKKAVSALLCMHVFFRKTLDDSLVTPFEQLCSQSNSPALRINGKKIVPLSSANRKRLVDESLLALLCACNRSNLPDPCPGVDSSSFPEAVGCLALAEINTRLGRDNPVALDQTGYSRDPDEARTQLLLNWMKQLNLSDANLVNVVTSAFFAQEWAKCTSALVSGAFKGVSRDTSTMFDQARNQCTVLSPRARTTGSVSSRAPSLGNRSAKVETPAITRPPITARHHMDLSQCIENRLAATSRVRCINQPNRETTRQ